MAVINCLIKKHETQSSVSPYSFFRALRASCGCFATEQSRHEVKSSSFVHLVVGVDLVVHDYVIYS